MWVVSRVCGGLGWDTGLERRALRVALDVEGDDMREPARRVRAARVPGLLAGRLAGKEVEHLVLE